MRALGLEKITVSSVGMAGYFAGDGWKDITIAFPVNPAEVADINKLAGDAAINVLVENVEGIHFLANGLDHETGVFIKLDAGYHRTGVEIEDHQQILALIGEIQSRQNLHFKGFVIHNGHTYHASGSHEIQEIHLHALEKVAVLKDRLKTAGIDAVYSLGDTPALSRVDDFENVDEIRPGNFVFYDVMQQSLGACRFKDIAVAMACPVVAKHPSRNQMVIYGGGVHFSREYLLNPAGEKCFGYVVRLQGRGWGDPVPEAALVSLSQEHGIIRAPAAFIHEIAIGDFIGILPVHSCLTVAAMRAMVTTDGEKVSTWNA